MDQNHTAIIILAAGKGTRMKSEQAKVLHTLLGRPMIQYVVETATRLAGDHVIVVVGHQADAVRFAVAGVAEARFAEQPQQLGTGHAVQCAMSEVDPAVETVVVLCGDVPLITVRTLSSFVEGHHAHCRDLSVLCVRAPDPTGYGRILIDETGRFAGIVEERDATDEQRTINLVNAGIYCINRAFLERGLAKIECHNAQGEYYLTDIVHVGYTEGLRIGIDDSADIHEVSGINTADDLARVEKALACRNTK